MEVGLMAEEVGAIPWKIAHRHNVVDGKHSRVEEISFWEYRWRSHVPGDKNKGKLISIVRLIKFPSTRVD